jgi:hypothetical protein
MRTRTWVDTRWSAEDNLSSVAKRELDTEG